MTAVTIYCPQCSASLKLPDRSLLGRRGKCPKCSHRFVLAEPEDVPLELAEPAAAAAPPARAVVREGVAARWVPDDVVSPPQRTVAEPPQDATGPEHLPVFDVLGSPGAAERAGVPRRRGPAAPVAAAADHDKQPIGAAAAIDDSPAFVPPVVAVASESVTKRIRPRRRRNPSGLMLLGIAAAVLLGTGLGGWLLRQQSQRKLAELASRPPAQVNAAWQQEQQDAEAANQQSAALSPTDGEPIPLQYIPFTPHLIFHLRPAELWQQNRQMAEFTATLSDLGVWLKQQIPAMTMFEPEEIAELTYAVNFGPRGSDPEVCAVVRLREPQPGGDLFRRFRGTVRPDLNADIQETAEHSYMLVDNQTFAVAPLALSSDLAAAKDYPAEVPVDFEALHAESDRRRLLTLLFDVQTLDIHREHVLMAPLQKIADQFVVWLGPQVETVSWSLHLQPHFFMETLLHPTTDSTPLRVQRSIQTHLESLPEDVYTAVQRMQPQSAGTRQIIGRFPAMLKALQLGTTADISARYVRLVTLLPAKAAGNLAAGTLLTWNQSLLTNFAEPSPAAGAATALPEKIADRLKLPVLIDFRNFPLQEAMAYIGEEIKTEIIIDGDALKAAGFTQNMNQTFSLGTVPAITALDAILQQYAAERDPMVIIVDEPGRRIVLATKSAAEQAGQAIFNTKP